MLSHAPARAQTTVRIPLHGKRGEGLVALVDAEDAPRVTGYRWRVKDTTGGPYARTGNSREPGVLMHRLILGLAPGDGRQVDHVNGDGLDNRRSNLRIATNAENAWNKRSTRGAVPLKGVRLSRGRYMAEIRARGAYHNLGRFGTAEEAARVYDEAARELHGAFAATNAALGLLTQDGER